MALEREIVCKDEQPPVYAEVITGTNKKKKVKILMFNPASLRRAVLMSDAACSSWSRYQVDPKLPGPCFREYAGICLSYVFDVVPT